MNKFSVFVTMSVVLVFAGIMPCAADDDGGSGGFPGDVPDRFRIRLGSVLGSYDTNLGVASEGGGLAVSVNFEDLLGLETSKSTFGIEGSWQIGGRHSLQFAWISSDRDGYRAPEREFSFRGYTILAGTAAQTDFEAEFISLGYRYDAYSNDEVRIYGSFGVTYLELATRIVAGVGVIGPDGEPLGVGFDRSANIETPMPTLGVGVEWAVSSRFIAQLYLRALYADTGDFEGGLNEAGLSCTWFFVRNLGLGIGVDRKDVRIREYDDGDYIARGSYSQLGAVAFLEAAF